MAHDGKDLHVFNLEVPKVTFLLTGMASATVRSACWDKTSSGSGTLNTTSPTASSGLIVPKGACEKAMPAYWHGDKPVGMVDVEPIGPGVRHFYGKAR